MWDIVHNVRHSSYICACSPKADTAQANLGRDSFVYVTWIIYMCDMTHSYVRHDAFICVSWRTHMCDMTHSYMCHDAFICVPWRIYTRDMTHSYAWHDSHNHICAVNHSNMCVRWDMTHSCKYARSPNVANAKATLWRDSFVYMMWSVHICRWSETWLIHVNMRVAQTLQMQRQPCDVTHSYIWCGVSIYVHDLRHDSFM